MAKNLQAKCCFIAFDITEIVLKENRKGKYRV